MKLKKVFTAILASALIVTMVPPSIVQAEGGDHEFYSSFESPESHSLIEDTVVETDGMATALRSYRGNGPSSSADPIYGNGNRGWNGSQVLRVSGTHPSQGRAYSTNIIYDDLDIYVSTDTQLSYVILPNYSTYTQFDWEFTSQYIGIDLEFSDGSRLSELGGVDQYGHGISGYEQGMNKHLYSKQWNQVKSIVGDVAAGKTIEKILVNYDKPSNDTGKELSIDAYIDCLTIRPVDNSPKDSAVEYANIFIGTNDKGLYSRGLQWPAIMTPNGFNIWSPSNYPTSTWLGSSYTGNKIYTPYPAAGITHFTTSHQASLWIGDFGRFQFMANTNYSPENSSIISPDSRRTLYDEDSVIANPNYYSVTLSDADNSSAKGVQVEISPTQHAAMVRMTFPEDSQYVNVLLDSIYATSGGSISIDGNKFTAVVADNTGEGRSRNMHVYGVFEQTPTELTKAYSPNSNARAIINFEEGTTEVNLKMATSFISADQAKKNLEMEIAEDATFEDVKNEAADTWNEIMDVIQVEGASEEEKVELYSNVFRLYADPLNLSENTGTNEAPVWSYASPYSGTASSPNVETGYQVYYNNGFWDTFRGSWAAYQLITPAYSTQLLNGLVQHYVDSDWIARWLAPAGRNSMVGTSSDIIFGDAVKKGINFDLENAYKASLKNASTYAPYALSSNTVEGYAGRAGMDIAPFKGYTRYQSGFAEGKGLSWSLDNYLNDLGVANMAAALGYTDEAVYFKNTAQNYVNLWNYANGGWFVGKNADGTWRYNDGLVYSTTAANSVYNRGVSDYEETNGYTMTFSAIQDVQGLINLYGGNEKFTERLDNFFTDETQYSGGGRDYVLDHYDSKMGQYGHANQPDHHIPYMYAYAGQPYKTQALTREILDRVHAGYSFHQGFPGDADNGQQSGWYLMSMMGFFPFSSGTDGYIITSPMHDKTTLTLPTGKIEIIANNNSHDNVYIQSMTIDGESYDETYITYADLTSASEIVFEMGPEPSDWACDSAPPSITDTDDDSVPNPLKDFTYSGVTIADSILENNHETAAAYATNLTSANTALLFNDTSGGNAVFTETSGSVYYYFPNAKKVEMVTLTSASALGASTPNATALYASNDGENWTLLDSRTDVEFDWARQTKPFAIDNSNAYNYYRLDLEAEENVSLSEVELMGYPVDIISYPSTAYLNKDTQQYAFDMIVDNAVSSVRFRNDNNFDIITPVSVTPASLNEDGTKTISIVLEAEESDIYVTAMDRSGNEITASRQTISLSTSSLNTRLLEYSIEYAEKAVAKGELDDVIDTVVNMFNDALKNAKTVLADAVSTIPTVDQDDIDEAVEKLLQAIHLLDFKKADKSDLEKLVKLAKTYTADKDKYTASTYTPFETALEEAEKILADNDLMDNQEVEDAWNTLFTAITDLRLIPDKSVLAGLLRTAGSYDLSLYTVETASVLVTAKQAAEDVMADENADQDTVDQNAGKLRSAIKDMKLKSDAKGKNAGSNDSDNTSGTKNTSKDNSGTKNQDINKASANKNNPKTGDSALIYFVIGLLTVSIAAVIISKKRQRR